MTRPALSELHSIRRSMQKRLAFYMITLAILLAATLVAGLFFFDQLKSPREGMVTSLNFRMEAFASDMESLWRNVSVMGVHLSEDMTDLIEERTADFSALRGDADAMEALQEAMLEPLCQYGRQVDCSGAFVLLNSSLGGDGSCGGLYIQRSNSARMASDFLLYRGMADVGRQHHVMPHRKWAQEFALAEFPGLAEHLHTASAPIERHCRTTALLTLPDTSERAILLTVPMLGADGTVYGLCGFAINQSYFATHHVQPSGIRSLACVLSDGTAGLEIPQSLITYPADGFCFVPEELLTEKGIREGLTAYSGTDLSFVGLSKSFLVASGDPEPHTLTVMLPKSDYDQVLLKSALELGGLLLLLLFFGVVCCLYYTRRYLRPVMRDIDLLKKEDGGEAQMPLTSCGPSPHGCASTSRPSRTWKRRSRTSRRGPTASALRTSGFLPKSRTCRGRWRTCAARRRTCRGSWTIPRRRSAAWRISGTKRSTRLTMRDFWRATPSSAPKSLRCARPLPAA